MSDRSEAGIAALRILARSDKTTAELIQKLKQKGFSREEAEHAAMEMSELGYLNDLRYAEHFLSYYRDSKSRTRMIFELRNKGISQEDLEAALENAASFDETDLIRRLVEKRLPDPDHASLQEIEKCKAYLYRQGFRMSDILSVLSNSGLT